jgi:DNA invertase Pin-like site-specific DNA recombinase
MPSCDRLRPVSETGDVYGRFTYLTIHILAAVAEHEREAISERTKAALAARQGVGKEIGHARWRMKPMCGPEGAPR